MRIAVKDLRPNPFRDLRRYPIDQSKVDALKASIKETEFWDNLVARKGPDGTYELAYGVHRWHALKGLQAEEVDIPVRKLDDTMMVKIMAHENQTEWSHSALVSQETIRVIVKAFGEGKIELPKASGNKARYAPSFVPGGSISERPEIAYSAETLAKFLGGPKAGWPDSKIEAILHTLAAVEKELIDEEDLKGLSTHQADQVAKQTRRVAKETGDETLAKNIGKRLATGMRSGTGVTQRPGIGGKPKDKSRHQAITYHGAKRAADEMMGTHRRAVTPKKMPDIETFAEQVVNHLVDLPSERMCEKLKALVEYRTELHSKTSTRLIGALRGLAKRAESWAAKMEG